MTDTILSSRRNFLIRASGFVALSAPPAAMLAASPLPTVTSDLVRLMLRFRDADKAEETTKAVLMEIEREVINPNLHYIATPARDAYVAAYDSKWEAMRELHRAIRAL